MKLETNPGQCVAAVVPFVQRQAAQLKLLLLGVVVAAFDTDISTETVLRDVQEYYAIFVSEERPRCIIFRNPPDKV